LAFVRCGERFRERVLQSGYVDPVPATARVTPAEGRSAGS